MSGDRDTTVSALPPTSLVLVAAGAGTRMQSDTRKPYLALQGRPVLFHTLARFAGLPHIDERILVVAAEDVERVDQQWPELRREYGVTQIVAGGSERVDSVHRGVQACLAEPGDRLIAIHDGVRPFVGPSLIERTCRAAREHGGAILAARVTDTIKQQADAAGPHPMIAGTVPREALWAAQTPQVFRAAELHAAFAAWIEAGRPAVTDDASLLERLGRPVALVEGSRSNIKLTTPDDLAWAEVWLARHAGGE